MIIGKVKIEQINVGENKTSKGGKAYAQVGIKTNNKWYNNIVWGNDIEKVKSINEGDILELCFFQEEYQGKMYSKWKYPSRYDQIEIRLKALEKKVFGKEEKKPIDVTSTEESLSADSEPDDLPF